MTWIYWVSGIGLLLVAILLMMKVKVQLTYDHRMDDDLLRIVVFVWGMKVYSFAAPLIKLDPKSRSIVLQEDQQVGGLSMQKKQKLSFETILEDFQFIQRFLTHVVGFHRIVRGFLSHVHVHHFHWASRIGLGEAARTGAFLSLAWIVKGTISGFVGNYMRLSSLPRLSITPVYQHYYSETKFSCMFSFRIGHAIVAGVLVLKHWRKRPKKMKVNSGESVSS